MSMKCEHCGKEVTGQYCHSCSRAATKSAGAGSKRKVLGICLIIGPWVGLIMVMSAYAIASFVTSAVVESSAQTPFIESVYAEPLDTEDLFDSGFDNATELGVNKQSVTGTPDRDVDMKGAIGDLVHVALGFLGVLCILGIFVGTPLGIYLLATDGKPKAK